MEWKLTTACLMLCYFYFVGLATGLVLEYGIGILSWSP